MISCHHQNHFNELGASRWQLPAEPEKTQHSTDTNVILEHLTDRDATILQLVAPVICDRANEACWFSDHAQRLGPSVIHWNLGRLAFGCLHNDTFHNQLCV